MRVVCPQQTLAYREIRQDVHVCTLGLSHQRLGFYVATGREFCMFLFVNWIGTLFAGTPRARRPRQPDGRYLGRAIDVLEDRQLLTAAPWCAPQQSVSPVGLKHGTLTITPVLNDTTSVSVVPSETFGYIDVFYTTDTTSQVYTFKDSQVHTIKFNGRNASATSTLQFYAGEGINDDMILTAGRGTNFFDVDSAADVLYVGTSGIDYFTGGTGLNFFDGGTGEQNIVTGTFINVVDCGTGTNYLDLYGGNLVYLNGTTTIYAEPDSYGIIIGNRREYLRSQISLDDGGCYVELVTWC